MSTTTIQFNFKVGAVPTNVTSAALSDPTGTFGVRRLDTLAVVVADGTALANTGVVGSYSYTFADPASGLTYNYWVEFVYNGNTYRIEQDISGGTGGGVSTEIADALPASCVTLARYAEIMEINECWLWGVNDGTEMSGACDHIWTNNERKRIARYLFEAQEEIEQVVGYPLCPRWFTAERHPYVTMNIVTKWGKLLDTGFQNSSSIDDDAPIDFTNDPAIVGPIATTVTDEDEIVVYYPDSTRTIEPSKITISGGNVTIEIPWCRLVKPEKFENTDTGWTYTDMTTYLSVVDVYRVYNDHSTEAGLIYPHRTSGSDCTCGCWSGCLTCAPYTENACEYIRNAEIGIIDVLPASYASSTWTAACPVCFCSTPEYVHVNYKAGLEELPSDLEEAIVLLATAKMPMAPCGCDAITLYWKEAKMLFEGSDKMAFGLRYQGAIRAWDIANKRRLQRGIAL